MNIPKELRDRLSCWVTKIPEKFFPLYLVGGIARDILLERKTRDMDFVLFGAEKLYHVMRREKGLAAFVIGENKAKTCYRLVNREDTEDYIDLCEIEGDNIEEDLSRRDLTLNAIALELSTDGSVRRSIDPFGGMIHSEERKVVAIGERAFRDDPLRLLRAFRFTATLGFTLDTESLEWITKNRQLLLTVSVERVREELLKILECRDSHETIRDMDNAGLLEQIFPEIIPMQGCEQNEYHHLDVWEHSLLVLENCEKVLNNLDDFFPDVMSKMEEVFAEDRRRSLLKLAALLHDVAKPSSMRKKESGKVTFYGHEEEGALMIEKIGRRLRFSNRDIDLLSLIVREHLHVKVLQNDEVKESTRIRWFNTFGDDTVLLTVMGMADILSKNARKVTEEVVQKYRQRSGEELACYFSRYKKSFAMKPLVTGNDLIALGFPPGKAFKDILAGIRDAQLNGRISTREEALEIVKGQESRIKG